MKFFCVFYDNHVRGDEARKRVIDAVQMEIRGDEARKPRSRNHFHKDKWRQLTYLSEQYIAHMLRCYKIGQPAPVNNLSVLSEFYYLLSSLYS